MTDNPAVVSAIIAALVALAVSLLSNSALVLRDLLNHKLARQREFQEYYNTVYRELFSPVISDVFLYIDMATIPVEGPSLFEQITVKDRALKKISSRIAHASPSLLSSFHIISSAKVGDESGQNPTNAELRFLHDFMLEYIEVLFKTSLYSDIRRENLAQIVARLMNYLFFFTDRREFAASWMFDNEFYTMPAYWKVRRQIDLEKKENDSAWDRQQQKIAQIYETGGTSTVTRAAVEREYLTYDLTREARRAKTNSSILSLAIRSRYRRKEFERSIAKAVTRPTS